MWGRKAKQVTPLSDLIQLDRIEDKLDYLIQRNLDLSQAHDALAIAVNQVTTDITNLIAAHVAGTPDANLVTLTLQLQAASAAVVAALAPAVATVA